MLFSRSDIDNPTISIVATSFTATRYSQPSSVGMQVALVYLPRPVSLSAVSAACKLLSEVVHQGASSRRSRLGRPEGEMRGAVLPASRLRGFGPMPAAARRRGNCSGGLCSEHLPRHAVASSKTVPTTQIACIMTAGLRASATTAFLWLVLFFTAMAHSFSR